MNREELENLDKLELIKDLAITEGCLLATLRQLIGMKKVKELMNKGFRPRAIYDIWAQSSNEKREDKND